MMLDLIVFNLDTVLDSFLKCASQILCINKASLLNTLVSFMSLLMICMHILFDFLHYIHTSCSKVVEVVITTLARYMYMVFL